MIRRERKPPGPTARARAQRRGAAYRAYVRVCKLVDLRDDYRCRGCDESVLRRPRHHHHIVFRSQCGEDTLENLVLLCADCHDAVHRTRNLVVARTDDGVTFTWRP